MARQTNGKQSPPTPREERGHPPDGGRRRPWRAALIILLIAGGGVLWYLLGDRDTSRRSDGTAGGAEEPARENKAVVTGHEGPASANGLAPIPTLGNRAEEWRRMDDPGQDGWESEALEQEAKAQLKALGKLIVHPGDPETPALESLVVPEGFRGDRLVPEDLEEVFSDGVLVVERPPKEGSSSGQLTGLDGLQESLAEAAAGIAGDEEARFEVKIVGVEPGEGGFATRQYVSLFGVTERGAVEDHATWRVEWKHGEDGTPPRLQGLAVERFERVRTRELGRPLFADCTEAALKANESYRTQLLFGTNHWLDRYPDRNTGVFNAFRGLSVGDVNADGLEDLYLCQEPGIPNKLFLQRPDGSLEDVARQWEVDWLADSRSALLLDLDNDGDQDLVVAMYGYVVVASNSGARFEIREVLACEGSTISMAAADYDQDGRLDFYVCVYGQSADLTGASPDAVLGDQVFFDHRGTAGNRFFRNEIANGEWKFAEVTARVGLDEGNYRRSLAAAWEDFDNDGDLDLCVANDFGPNNMYLHTQVDGKPKFVDIAARAAAEDVAFGMSASWGDYDRDGWMDLYIANMFSSAGQRVTSQARFKSGLPPEKRGIFQRLARGNTLLRNHGPSTGPGAGSGVSFRDESVEAGVTMGRWAWGSNFVDLNNDGWEDLVIANGFVTGEDADDL